MSSSDFNLKKIDTQNLSEHVAASIQVGSNIAIFGRRGSGKTEIAKQEIKKSGYQEIYLNLSVLERTDLGGYPDIMGRASADASMRKFVSFLMPHFYQPLTEGKKGVVALLDELDKADPSLWAPLLEFTQFHSINGMHLPNLKAVIMTGNLISEGGSRPSLPLLDRAEKYLVEPSASNWLNWSGKVGKIHPSITSFISDNPRELFGNVDPEERYADPSPRGWDRASKLIYMGEEKGWSSTLINDKVTGCIGKEAGLKYACYYEHYQQLLPLIDQIYKSKDVTKEYNLLEPTKKLVACMIACARLTNILDEPNDKKGHAEEVESALTNMGKFLSKVPYENTLVAVRSQIQIDRLVKWKLDEHKSWQNTLSKIAKAVEGN